MVSKALQGLFVFLKALPNLRRYSRTNFKPRPLKFGNLLGKHGYFDTLTLYQSTMFSCIFQPYSRLDVKFQTCWSPAPFNISVAVSFYGK